MPITLTYEDDGLAVDLAQAPKVTGLMLQRWLTDVVMHMVGAVQANIGSDLIGRRTGNLARAITQRVTVTPGGATGEIWPDRDKAVYGSIQEEGGTIVPKKARMLAIPLAAMQTANGVARGTAGQVRDNPAAFGFKSTFIPKGHSVIMGVLAGSGNRPKGLKGSANTVIPLFALVGSVTIPGRHYLSVTLRQELTWIMDRLEALTGEWVSLTFGGDAA